MKIVPLTVYETAKAEFPRDREQVLGWTSDGKRPKAVVFKAQDQAWLWNTVTVRITHWARYDFTQETAITSPPPGVDLSKRKTNMRTHNSGA